MRPCQTILVLEDLCDSHKGSLHRRGVRLTPSDSQTAKEIYIQWIALMLDLGYLSPETLKREGTRLFIDLIKRDVLVVNNAFADLLQLVRNQSSTEFKALCGKVSDHLYRFIRDDFSSCLESDVYAAQRLVQLFSYTSRLTLHDIDLTEECLDDYMSIENSLDPLFPVGIISNLNSILTKWMKGFDDSDLEGKHGPGGVAGHGRTSIETKYLDLTSDPLLRYSFPDLVPPLHRDSEIVSTLDRISQTIFVPKSYKTFRTISMESSTLQFYQQAVWGEIDRVVSSSSYLRNHIGFHDQTRNVDLAKEGSLNRKYATLDLSAASDSVSWELVKRLFKGTKLLRYLFSTRSSRTLLPDGRLIQLKKFAPMGSALCFPIETLIFAAICQFVTQEHGVYGDYSVFGDDIIVPTQCTEDVDYYLDMLGFSLNRQKSFFNEDCWFRESCGGEFVDGFDVTPLRVSRKFQHIQDDIKVQGMQDMANTAYHKGFYNLRRVFLNKLLGIARIPLFSPTSIVSDNYSNYHTRRRWNRHLLRIDAEVTLVKVDYSDRNEDIAYQHWLRSTRDRKRVFEPFVSNTGTLTMKTRKGWVEKPYEPIDNGFIDFHLGLVSPSI